MPSIAKKYGTVSATAFKWSFHDPSRSARMKCNSNRTLSIYISQKWNSLDWWLASVQNLVGICSSCREDRMRCSERLHHYFLFDNSLLKINTGTDILLGAQGAQLMSKLQMLATAVSVILREQGYEYARRCCMTSTSIAYIQSLVHPLQVKAHWSLYQMHLVHPPRNHQSVHHSFPQKEEFLPWEDLSFH